MKTAVFSRPLPNKLLVKEFCFVTKFFFETDKILRRFSTGNSGRQKLTEQERYCVLKESVVYLVRVVLLLY